MITDREIDAEQDRAEEAWDKVLEDAKKWRAMMSKEKENCGNCRFWRGLNMDAVYPADDIEESGTIGHCRRYPHCINPAIELEEHSHNSFAWTQPVTWSIDWCGEYQPNQPQGGGADSGDAANETGVDR